MQTTKPSSSTHAGPHPGFVALVYTLLFNAGLYFVISFTGGPHFPGPWESGDTIAAYFQAHPAAVLWCVPGGSGAVVEGAGLTRTGGVLC